MDISQLQEVFITPSILYLSRLHYITRLLYVQYLGAGDTVPPVRDFSLQEIDHRYQTAVYKEEAKLARKGRGVSETAQKIFDLVSRK